jgi:protease I
MTSYKAIQDDMRNAGASVADKEVVRDSNWITSRQPSDIPEFNRAMLSLFIDHHVRSRVAA